MGSKQSKKKSSKAYDRASDHDSKQSGPTKRYDPYGHVAHYEKLGDPYGQHAHFQTYTQVYGNATSYYNE